MNILYLHGFLAKFDIQSEKNRMLSTIGNVYGLDIDYSKSFQTISKTISSFIFKNDIDIVVGTSMGGYYAINAGNEYDIPFVAINPVYAPSISLEKRIGPNQDFSGNIMVLDEEIVKEYPDAEENANSGMILLDRGDELIDWKQTYEIFKDNHKIITFDDGCHRFSHMKESLQFIKNFHYNFYHYI